MRGFRLWASFVGLRVLHFRHGYFHVSLDVLLGDRQNVDAVAVAQDGGPGFLGV